MLLASYDQGIFQQVLWNSFQGHPFESTLSSQLSASVGQGGELPSVDYERLDNTSPQLCCSGRLCWG